MNLESSAQLLWGVGALVLAVSALVARRPSRSTIIRSLLAWILIAALILLAVVSLHHLGVTAEEPGQASNSSSVALVPHSRRLT